MFNPSLVLRYILHYLSRDLSPGLSERCSATGFTITFWSKDELEGSQASKFIDFQDSKNGIKVLRYEVNKIRIALLTDVFVISCNNSPMNYGNASEWHHFGVSFRIRPSPKLSCYLNGRLYQTQFKKSSRYFANKSKKEFFIRYLQCVRKKIPL